MANEFYTHTTFPVTGSAGSSALMRAELDAISSGFDKLPALTGNANKVVAVNGSGTGLTSTTTLSGLALSSSALTSSTVDSTSVGATTPSTGAFTTLSASSTVSGTGFSDYLASPPAIGGTTASTGRFTTLTATGLTSGRVTYAGASGLLQDSTNLTFDGTSLTLGGNPTLSAGTANGVLYLNGSKVATSGSALTFDGANLGVGVAVPGQVIDGSAANPRLRLTATSTGYAATQFVNTSGSSYFGRDNSAGGFFGIANGTAIYSSTSDPIGFYLGGSEQMRLTSTGLGIGTTSPQRSLHINSSVGAMRLQGSSVGGYIEIVGPTTTNYIGTPAAISSGSTTDLGFYLNGSERARITATGNQVDFQPPESAQNTSATLSVAQLQNRIITSNAAVTLTLPTGTTLEGYTTGMSADTAFECTFIATTANAITIAANGNTTVGNLTVSGNTSGTFRFRKTATNTFTVYRVA